MYSDLNIVNYYFSMELFIDMKLVLAAEDLTDMAGYLVKTRNCPRSGLCTMGVSGH